MNNPNTNQKIRDEMRTLYSVQSGPLSGSSLFSLPDDVLFWVISCLRGRSVPVLEVEDIQWSQFFEVLSSHYIIPLIWYNLKKGNHSVLPPSWVMERMQGIYRDVSIRTLRTDNQITQIVNQLKKEKISPIILKGPALGHQVYPFPALRNGSDIDILVHPDEVQVAIASLREIGYKPHIDAHAASTHAFHHVALLPKNRNDALAIEIHWRLLFLPGEITPSMKELSNRKIEIRGACGSFYALDIPDSFIYAATHMTIGHSSMIRLSWIADIYYMAQYLTEQNEWDELFQRISGGVLLAAIKRACKEAAFWFSPGAPFAELDFFPLSDPGSNERFSYLSAVVGRPERHLIEVFRDANTIREGLTSAGHILFMTNEIEWGSTTLTEKIRFFEVWVRVAMNLLKIRIFSPSSEESRSPE